MISHVSCSRAPAFEETPAAENLQLEEKSASIKVANSPFEIGNNVGNSPPLFELKDIEGNLFRLSDYTDSGKPVLIYFYATWCPYCHKDFAELSRLYANYRQNVTIIAINLDPDESLETIANYKSKFPQLSNVKFAAADTKILVDYEVVHTTTKYAIKEGKIIYSGSGVFSQRHWNILLSELSK